MQTEPEADRLARVRLSCTIEPGDLRVTGLVSELGASKVLGYIEAAADVESHWAASIGQELAHVDPSRVLEQAADLGIRFLVPGDAGPTSSERSATPARFTTAAVSRSGCGSGGRATSVRLPRPRWRWSDRELRQATARTRRAL